MALFSTYYDEYLHANNNTIMMFVYQVSLMLSAFTVALGHFDSAKICINYMLYSKQKHFSQLFVFYMSIMSFAEKNIFFFIHWESSKPTQQFKCFECWNSLQPLKRLKFYWRTALFYNKYSHLNRLFEM